MKTLLIDNYDSYTYNLYQYLADLNQHAPVVVKNDACTWEILAQEHFDNIVLSPGPGRPERLKDFGLCRDAILKAKVPLLGVCLGHQGLAHLFGATIHHAQEPFHGRNSEVLHDGKGLFQGIPSPMSVIRYHSLVVQTPLPRDLQALAHCKDGTLMALKHRHRPLWGVQFHPESIGTEFGKLLLENFHQLTQLYYLGLPSTDERKNSFTHKSLEKIQAPEHSKNSARPKNPQQGKHGKISHRLHIKRLDLMADSEQIFMDLYSESHQPFWLDSSLVREGLSRFSFMGHGQREAICLRTKPSSDGNQASVDAFEQIRRHLEGIQLENCDLPFNFRGGLVGYLGYGLKGLCGGGEQKSQDPGDARFLEVDQFIAIDHLEQHLYLVHVSSIDDSDTARSWLQQMERRLSQLKPLPKRTKPGASQAVSFKLNQPKAQYLSDIDECIEEIFDGESYEVCLTNRLESPATPKDIDLYRILRCNNPAPYAAFLRFNDLSITCSSPERFLGVSAKGKVESKPIKGTRPRSENPQTDQNLAQDLAQNIKDRAENMMIVDLLRNDLGRVCEIGSVHVPKLMQVESYQTVHQLVSTVRGQLREDLSSVDCVKACFPGGSMTGAPKVRTMQIIDRLEKSARGIYAGALGYFSYDGAVDLNIVIRSAILTKNGLSIGVGGAIVALSDRDNEYQEMLLKGQALMASVAEACTGLRHNYVLTET